MTDPSAAPARLGRRLLARFGRAGVSFAGSKAAVFLVPLLLSNLLDRAQYGQFEYAYGVGSLAATVAALGLPAAVPAFLLERRRPAYTSVFFCHLVWLGLALGPFAVAHVAGWAGTVVFAAAVLTAAIAAQAILSSYFKTTGLPAYASLAESGVYLAVLCVAGVVVAAGRPLTLAPLVWGAVVYVLGLAAKAARRGRPFRNPAHLRRRYRAVLGFGVPIVFSSFLMLAVTSSGRLLVGTFLGVADVATYSFFFRLAAPVVLLHQLIHTLFFPRLYVSSTKDLDRYFSFIASLIYVCAMCLYLVVPRLLSGYFNLLSEYGAAQSLVYYSLSTQMVYWVLLALTEPIVYRNGLGPRLIWVLLGHAAVLTVLCAGASRWGALSLLRICQIHLFVLFSASVGQLLLLWKRGFRLPKTLAVSGGGLAFHLLLLLVGIAG